MSTINPLTLPPADSGKGSSGTGNTLDKNDFLKLLVAQLRHQDPLNPTQDQEFIATMAQFATLEQITNLAKTNEETKKTIEDDHAVGLIGKTVTYEDADGNKVTGVVEKVSRTDEGTTLTVGGKDGIDPDKVTEVK
jgi:flagellar basal-body rod modification protein FlgD